MAFIIPAVKDVVQRARNAFRTEMPGSDAWVWPNNVYVSAKVIGGAVWESFGRLAWLYKNMFAMTAEGYELERHGLEFGITRKQSSFAYGNVLAYAAYPYTVAAGTVFTRSNTDGTYTTFTSTRAVDVGKYTGFAEVPVVCDTAGKIGNTTFSTSLTYTDSSLTLAVVDDLGIGQGADIETDEQLRNRILLRKRYPPHGGCKSDYIQWALSLPGVTRVFVAPDVYGRGTVGVWFLMDDDTHVAGIPSDADVAVVQAYIDAVAPITARVFVMAPIAQCVDITINNIYPDTQATREAAAAELKSVFTKMATVGVPDKAFTLYRSWLWQAVANATDEEHHEIVAPATDLTFAVGVIPCLRSVIFTSN